MILPKRFVIPIAAAAVATVGLGAGAATMAASGQPGALAQKIASAFHLDPSKVQSVIDQNKSDNATSREQRYEDRLSQAVTAGKLTSGQKQTVLDEHNKLKSELSGAASLSATDRRALMQKLRTEAEAWSKQNNLPMHWLELGPFGRRFDHMRSHDTAMPSPSASPSA